MIYFLGVRMPLIDAIVWPCVIFSIVYAFYKINKDFFTVSKGTRADYNAVKREVREEQEIEDYKAPVRKSTKRKKR